MLNKYYERKENHYFRRLSQGSSMNRLHLIRFCLLPGFLLGLLSCADASVSSPQQRDPGFSTEVSEAAFGHSQGPLVCIDEAHNNFHTAEGRYRSFADLLRKDGYRVGGFSSRFSEGTLSSCALLVIANALNANDGPETRAFPHPSPFTHPALFERKTGTLVDHPISRGRTSEEQVESVATFAGQAFQLSQHFQPLLIFGEGSLAHFDISHNVPDVPRQEWPMFSVSGWAQGAAREWDSGRIVVLGEAAMCSAQLKGEKRNAMGMNHPRAGENAQFCLNAVRWLMRVLP